MAKNETYPTQQDIVIVPETKKEPQPPQTRPIKHDTAPVKDYKEFLLEVSIKYGQNYDMMETVIQGESSFNPIAVGPGGLSVGQAQFTLDTWLQNCSPTDERTNPWKSMDCMGKLWAKGEQHRWDVFCTEFGNEKCIKLRGLYPR